MISPDQEKLEMQQLVSDYLNNQEWLKLVRNIINKTNRLNINMDDLRKYNPKLAQYVTKDPLSAIKMFQD